MMQVQVKCLNLIGRDPDLICRLSLPILQLLGVLLPNGENPVVAAKVVSARRLAVLLSDWTNSKNDFMIVLTQPNSRRHNF